MLVILAAVMIAVQGTPGAAAPASATPSPSVAAVPGRTLKDLPNVTINFFDVAGKDLKAINKSIAQLQAVDSSGKAKVPPTTWDLDIGFNKSTTGTVCKVVGAKANFKASATLPRLVPHAGHTPQLLAAWRDHVAVTENTHAANLWFVYDRKGEIEKAILASSCEGARAAGTAALERLKAQAAEFRRVNTPPTPMPAPATK
jgi:predicted secreted Zn-dependent protease